MKLNKIFIILLLSIISVNICFGAVWDFQKNTSVSSYTNNPTGITHDGVNWWIVDPASNNLYKTDSSFTNLGSYSVNSQDANVQDVVYDGAYLWIVGSSTDSVYKYNLAGTYQSESHSVESEDSFPTGMCYDGTHFYILGSTTDKIYQYNSTWSYTGVNISVSSQGFSHVGLICDNIMSSFWMLETSAGTVAYEYDTSWAYQSNSVSLNSEDSAMEGGVNFNSTIYTVGLTNDRVYEYEGYSQGSGSIDFINISYNNRNLTSYPYINTISPVIDVEVQNISTNNIIDMYYNYFNSTFSNSLIAFYSFNDKASTDLSNNANNGVDNGNNFSLGDFLYYTSFDGVDDYISLDSNFIFDSDVNYTVSYWAKLNNIGDDIYIFSNSTDVGIQVFRITQLGGTTYNTQIRLDSGSWCSGGSFTMDTNWHHYTVTFEKNGAFTSCDYYRNGNYIGTDIAVKGDLIIDEIGRHNLISEYSNFSLDEIMIFNESLNTNDINFLYNNTSPKLFFKTLTVNNQSVNYSNSQPDGMYLDEDYIYVWGTGPSSGDLYKYNLDWTFIKYINVTDEISYLKGFDKYNNSFYVYDGISDIIYKYDDNFTYSGTSYDISSQGSTVEGLKFVNNNVYVIQGNGINFATVYKYDDNFIYSGTSYDFTNYTNYVNGFTYKNGYFYVLGGAYSLTSYKFDENLIYTGDSYTPYFADSPHGLYNYYNMFAIPDRVNDIIVFYDNEFNNPVSNGDLTGSFELNNLLDSSYNLYICALNNETSSVASSFFIIDLITPTIINNIPTEINSYSFNGSLFSCSDDVNISSCNVSIQGLNKASGTNFNFTYNGNYSYNITAIDLGGNTLIESGNLLINPINYFYFNSTNGTQINNFSINGVNYEDYANITHYSLGLGNVSLNFSKQGYITQSFTYLFNTTNELNETETVVPSKIILSIYDRETLNLITSNTSITLVSTLGYSGSTVTGLLNISDVAFINEIYQIILSNDDYITESIYFNYTNEEELNVNAYLIKSNQTNAGTVNILVTADTGQLIQGAVCKALEWKTDLSSFIAVAQGLTNSNGLTTLNIELETKLYKFICTKSTASTITESQIITTTDTTIPIELFITTTAPVNIYKDLSFSFINETINSTHQRLTYTFNDNNNLVNEACLKINKKIGLTLTELQSSCISSSSGQIQLIQNINQTYNIVAIATIDIDNKITELGVINFLSVNDIRKSLKDYGLNIILPLVFALIGMSIGFMLKPKNIYISAVTSIIMVWTSVLIVPSIISGTIGLFVTFICILMLWGGYKPR